MRLPWWGLLGCAWPVWAGVVSVDNRPVESIPEAGYAIRTAAGAQTTLEIGRHGFAELGGDGELVLERAPFASYAEDLLTVLRLEQGLLRIVWRHPALSAPWPLQIQAGAHRLSLHAGEFLLETAPGEMPLLCALSGDASLESPGGGRPELLRGPACHALTVENLPLRRPLSPPQIERLRRSAGLREAVASTNVDLPPPQAPPPPPPPPPPLRAVAPPAVPAPARAPAPAPQEPLATGKATGGHWIVNAASSADAAAALALVGRLQAAGLRARTLAVEIDGRRWHRVQVDAGSDREGALDLAQRIRRDFGLDSPWVSKADTPAAAGQRR